MSQEPGSSSSSSLLASDCSSLVDLKAEVFRKQQEAKFNKNKGQSSSKDDSSVGGGSSAGGNKDAIWSKQNAGLTQREKRDLKERLAEDTKVRNALEVKAKLYEQLKEGHTRDNDQRFLVNFDKQKDSYVLSSSEDEDDYRHDRRGSRRQDDPQPRNEGEEWVEYIDSLGRSRMAMKKDLSELKSRDKDLEARQTTPPPGVVQNNQQTTEDETPDLMSEDMRRDLLRQKWEQEEEENLRKTKLHYRDVLYDEARTHGAAFYNFSRDEAKRTEELDNLEAMHKETEATRSANDKAKAKRKAALALRLKKVRDRKRLKMGLPVTDDNPDGESQPEEGPDEEEDDKKMDKMVLAGLKEMREIQEKAKKRGGGCAKNEATRTA